MIANAHNEKPSFGVALRLFFCMPFTSSGNKRDQETLVPTSEGRLSNPSLPIGGGEEKSASIVYEQPPTTRRPSTVSEGRLSDGSLSISGDEKFVSALQSPATSRPSTILDIMSQKYASTTVLCEVEEEGDSLRSKFCPPPPPPRDPARVKKKSINKIPSYSLPLQPVVQRMRRQSWPCVLNLTDANQSAGFRRSFPPLAFYYPCSPSTPTISEDSAVIIFEKKNKSSPNLLSPSTPPTTRLCGTGRSRAYSMPVRNVKRHIATLVKVDMLPESPLAQSVDGIRCSTVAVRPHIYNCGGRTMTIPPSPHTPLSFDVSLSKFPLPPSRPLLLEPLASENRKSLSFVSQWLYLQTNESFLTLDTDISTPMITTEIIL